MLEIKLDNLSFSYGKNFPNVINNFSYSFKAGNTYHISGDNGSGKSTLLKIISGIIENENISYLGFNDFIAPTCSYFNQNLGLYSELSVIENINFYKSIVNENHDEFIEELLEKFSLKKLLQKKVFELSSGQKVKAALLLKLFFKPKVLLLDEPGNNLDKDSKKTLYDIVSKLKAYHKNDFMFVIADHLDMFSDLTNKKLEL